MVFESWSLISGGGLPAAVVVARVAVGTVLLIAGAAKIRAGESQFFKIVLAYDLLPALVARWLARVLPPAEVGAGALLILGLLTRPAAAAGLVLLIPFTGATALALARGKEIPCGCFGLRENARPIRWTILVRNSGLILALVGVLLSGHSALSIDGLLGGFSLTGQWLVGLALASGIAVAVRGVPVRGQAIPISVS